MKHFVWLFISFLTVGAPNLRGEAKPMENPAVRGSNQFALDLYDHLRSEKGNLFFSPSSISTALTMTYAGARGETAKQIAQVLHADLPADKLAAEYAKLLRTQRDGGKEYDFEFATANAFWGQNGYTFVPQYTQLLQANFGAILRPVDFGQSEQARQTINHWVEQQTKGKIQDLIPSRGIDPAVRLVLTNAVYFKAAWDKPFNPLATQEQPFHLLDGTTSPVQMMHQMEPFRYLHGDSFSALDMSYADGAFSMTVFLPAKADGLPALEKQLVSGKLVDWLRQIDVKQTEEVRVEFPKFRGAQDLSLRELLSRMGMPLAFDPHQADLFGINGGREPLWLSAAFHKAYVDVNERGTEAAAATGFAAAGAAMLRQPPVFSADHPFGFVIRDRRTGQVLFMGRVVKPE
jgi:serpin B